MDSVLNFDTPLDVQMLERVVLTAYLNPPSAEAQRQAQNILTQLLEHPNAWTRVDGILDRSQCPHTRYFAFQVLDAAVRTRWFMLAPDQRQAIRGFVANFIFSSSSDGANLQDRAVKAMLSKADECLVHILKHEWPHNWPTFTQDLVSSRGSPGLMVNNFQILRMLSEEVFNYGAVTMTRKTKEQKREVMRRDYVIILRMCMEVLESSDNVDVVRSALAALEGYIAWLPVETILETNMVMLLGAKFLPTPVTRNASLRCLIEIASMTAVAPQHRTAMEQLFHGVMAQFGSQFNMDVAAVKDGFDNGGEDVRDYVHNMSMFLTTMFTNHLTIVENTPEAVVAGHLYLNAITNVDDKEIFKLCVDYWLSLCQDLFAECSSLSGSLRNSPRANMYTPVLSALRLTVIMNMPRPEEVVLIEDEGGLHKEYMTDVEMVDLYQTMRKMLVLLVHLDSSATESLILGKLERQYDLSEFTWARLNTLCWAVGSLGGAMSEPEERQFFMRVLRGLLQLSKDARGVENKAVIASNVMYVVGQYPRFLRNHHRFYKTVLDKLVTFMHEKFEGVQEMAVDTLLKIVRQCGDRLSAVQPNEETPYIKEFIDFLPQIICDLEPAHIHVVYEVVGEVVSKAPNTATMEYCVPNMMRLVRADWDEVTQVLLADASNFRNPAVVRRLIHVLRCESWAGRGLKHAFVLHVRERYPVLMSLYSHIGTIISEIVAQHNGPHSYSLVEVRLLKMVKREIIKIIQIMCEETKDPEPIRNDILPLVFNTLLRDYCEAVPPLREAHVLSLVTSVVDRFGLEEAVPLILDSTLASTMEMLSSNMQDYPDHRVNIFKLLAVLTRRCFPALLEYAQNNVAVIEAMLWAMQHNVMTVSSTGVDMMTVFLCNVSQCDAISQRFYQTYYVTILTEVLVAMTDTLHKADFGGHVKLLFQLIKVAEIAPCVAMDQPQGMDSITYVKNFLGSTLSNNFPNLTPLQLETFLGAVCNPYSKPLEFKAVLRDFLLEVKEWGSRDAEELFKDDDDMDENKNNSKGWTDSAAQSIPGYVTQRHETTYARSGLDF
eukprot:PhM_4_TR1225/c0_g1_i1/m.24325/K14290/XPO1, CRM1; exportin-1